MSLSLTTLIVTFKSDKIIEKTLKSVPKNSQIILIENSNNKNFKKKYEKKYKNLKCILTRGNLGFGNALNLALKKVKTKNIMFLNPDCFIKKDDVLKLYHLINNDEDLHVIAPETIDYKNRPNQRHGYEFFSKNKIKIKKKNLIKVDFISGHIFLIKKLVLERVGYYDKNIFLNFEERDLFRRMNNKNFNAFIVKNIYAKHLEGQSANNNYLHQMELSSKWHYHWGLIYFTRKHYGILISLVIFFYSIFLNSLKFFYFLLKFDVRRSKIIYFSILGLFASILFCRSFYRPNIK